MFGTINPHYDIFKLLRLYDAGKLNVDEPATRHYRLEDVNRYADMVAGRSSAG